MPLLFLLALLSTLRSPFASGASNFHKRDQSGLLLLYDFREGQQFEEPPPYIRDSTGRNLLGNLTTSTSGAVDWSASQQGMSVPSPSGGTRAESQLPVAPLLAEVASNFSIEFFFRSPTNPRSQSLLIAGFGDWLPGIPFPECSTTEGGWHISSDLGPGITFNGVMQIGGSPQCQSVSISIEPDSLCHFVVRMRPGSISLVSHLNSFSVTDPSVQFSTSNWLQKPSKFAIATPHTSSGWTGTMYMVAMYNRYLSNAEIAANRILGPPNSLPVTTPSLSIPEDETTTLYP